MGKFETALADHIHELRRELEEWKRIAHAGQVFQRIKDLERIVHRLQSDLSREKKRAELWKLRSQNKARK